MGRLDVFEGIDLVDSINKVFDNIVCRSDVVLNTCPKAAGSTLYYIIKLNKDEQSKVDKTSSTHLLYSTD